MYLSKNYTVKTYGGVDVKIHVFLSPALVGGDWFRSCRFVPGERATGTNCIGGWAAHRTHLEDKEERKFFILPGMDLQLITMILQQFRT
jgi:hypothetical protein